jgi:hypothetical protein
VVVAAAGFADGAVVVGPPGSTGTVVVGPKGGELVDVVLPGVVDGVVDVVAPGAVVVVVPPGAVVVVVAPGPVVVVAPGTLVVVVAVGQVIPPEGTVELASAWPMRSSATWSPGVWRPASNFTRTTSRAADADVGVAGVTAGGG